MSPGTLILVIVVVVAIALVLFLVARNSRARDGARSEGYPTRSTTEDAGRSAVDVVAMHSVLGGSDSHGQRDQHRSHDGGAESLGHDRTDIGPRDFDSGSGTDGGSAGNSGGGGDGGGGSSGSD